MSKQLPATAATHLPGPVAAALNAAWVETPTSAVPLEAVVAAGRHRTRHIQRTVAIAVLSVAATLVAAANYGTQMLDSAEVARDPQQVAVDSSPEALPAEVTGRMFVKNGPYRPGQIFEIHWPQGEVRGIGYSLDHWDGSAWSPTFLLRSAAADTRGEAAADWWPAGEGGSWDDIALTGPGPDIAVVPEAAQGGTYRLCTANSPQRSCSLVQIKDEGALEQEHD